MIKETPYFDSLKLKEPLSYIDYNKVTKSFTGVIGSKGSHYRVERTKTCKNDYKR